MTDELISKTDVVKIVKSVLSPASSLTNVARARRQMLNEINELESKPEPHWIPVEQALPEEPFGCLVTVWDTNPVTMDEFENILPYFVGWDGEQWNDADGEQCPFEVLAYMPLPEPFKGVTE